MFLPRMTPNVLSYLKFLFKYPLDVVTIFYRDLRQQNLGVLQPKRDHRSDLGNLL